MYLPTKIKFDPHTFIHVPFAFHTNSTPHLDTSSGFVQAKSDNVKVEWSINMFSSSMLHMFVEIHRLKYGIPRSISLEVAKENEFASTSPVGSIALHLTFFRCGLILHLRPYLSYIC